jgi:cation:H+ antiporter
VLSIVLLVAACLFAAVGPTARLAGLHHAPLLEIALYGLSILGAAAVLAWATEVAQLEISRALAYSILALIAVLPEYAVDMYFAWTAASNPEYAAYAAANMTGANRLLIGVGWPLVVLLAWLTARRILPARAHDAAEAAAGWPVRLPRDARLDLGVLAVATAYCFWLPIKGHIGPLDTVILVALFAFYAWRVSKAERGEPELMGPAAVLAALPRGVRRLLTLLLFGLAAASIFLVAEPFAEALIEAGTVLGVSRFLLVQWLAPLASEAPELIVVALLAVRGQAGLGLAALLASKVNQWTLLVGMLPLAYSAAAGEPRALPLDTRQAEEVFLTAAQSLLAVALLLRLRLTGRGALGLFALFAVQFIFPELRVPSAVVYLVLAGVLGIVHRAAIPAYLPGRFGGPRSQPSYPEAPG